MGFFDLFKRGGKSGPMVRRPVHVKVSGQRGFAGAENGRLLNGWNSVPQTPDEVLRNNLSSLRARSRDSFHNNDFVRRYISLVRANVVGPRGIILQSRVKDLDGTPDYYVDNAIEEAWADWSRRENCDATGKLSWKELQWQAITSAAVDGEVLVRLVRGRQAGKYGLQVQHLDPELLDPSYFAEAKGGNRIRMGIEFDAMMRPAAYHLRDYVGGQYSYLANNGREYIRIPAGEMVHAFIPDQVGQSRGYPWMSTAMLRLKMLDGYFEAAITAARAGAAKMGFITSADGASYVGDDTDADGATISEIEAGVIEQLQDGQEFQAFDPKYPHEQFPEFVKSCLRSIAGSLGVSYSGLSNDLEGVNYSSIRTGVLDEREEWKSKQEWFIAAYCRPIYEAWLKMALTTGQLKVAGQPLKASREDKYRQVYWQARRWSWVDPAKDMAANIDAINNNITTISAVIRDQGHDPEDVFVERAAERARLEELGLSVAQVVQQDGASDGTEQ